MNPFSVLEYAQANISIPSSLLRRKTLPTKEHQQQKTPRQPQLEPLPRRSSPLAPHSQLTTKQTPGRPPQLAMQRTLSSTSIDRGHSSSGITSAPNVPQRLLRRQSSSATVHAVLRDDQGTASLPRKSASARASMDGRYSRPSLKDITMAFGSSSSSSTTPSSPSDPLKPRSFSASAASSEARWNARFHKKTPSSTSSSSWLSTPPMPAVVAAVTGVVSGAGHTSSLSNVPPMVDDDLVLPPPVSVKRTNSSDATTASPGALKSPMAPSLPRKFSASARSSTGVVVDSSSSVTATNAALSAAAPSSMTSSSGAKTTDLVTEAPPTPPASPPTTVDAKSPSFLGRLPRPSPLGPFRAARRVVSSVTQAGTGLLPSKDQLESLPVAGRILKHPVMDSTLNYIASKAPGLHQRDQRRLFDPHHDGSPLTAVDEQYRKLNRRLVEQSVTLSALAVEKEALSRTGEDEAADEAFELYLAAVATLMHALPIETCDPLRREAFENQLKTFLTDCEQYSQNVGRLMDEHELAKHRRRRRRRHRHHREQASYLIQHTLQANEQAAAAAAAAQAAEARRLTTRLSSIIDPRRYFGGSGAAGPAPPSPPSPSSSSSTMTASSSLAPAAAAAAALAGPLYVASGSTSSLVGPSSSQTSGAAKAGLPRLRQQQQPAQHRVSKRRRRQAQQREARKGLSDKIVSTAVDSAIRLKQSRIPGAVGAAFRASRFILGKVDERFHLQEKAWSLSRQGVEKAMELDQQYAIHEMVAETFFATVTGLVKAGIAYKEAPGYADLQQQQIQQQQQEKEGETSSSSSSSSSSSAARGLFSTIAAAASEVNTGVKRRVNNPQLIVSAEQMAKSNNRSEDGDDGDDAGPSCYRHEHEQTSSESDYDSDGYDSEVTDSSESSYFEDEEEGAQVEGSDFASKDLQGGAEGDLDEEEEGDDGLDCAEATKDGGFVSPYAEQVRQKIDLFMTLKGAASLFVGNI